MADQTSPSPVRVRFAPAPTGFLHVGSGRSALFNWLAARHMGGTLVLRIEDTNAALATQEFYDAITEPLAWLGIDWDEGPYYQSERSQLYLDAVQKLLDEGKAYFCDCSQDEINQRAKERKGSGYDGHCRDRQVADGEGISVRFQTPDSARIEIQDLVRGRVKFEAGDLEDFVIRRGNGTPVFLVANAVDDADMGITHVIRGEDLLNTTPKVILLWDALDLGDKPVYAHLPLLVGADRKKLSKRKDSVALADFKAQGYLPQAMANHMALLGWGPKDDVEIRPMAEIVEMFELSDVNKAPAYFDMKKLNHFNAEYIRAMSTDEFVAAAQPWLDNDAPWTSDQFDAAVFAAVAPDVQQRVNTLAEVPHVVDWLFLDDPVVDEDDWAKAMTKDGAQRDEVRPVLEGALAQLADCPWDPEALQAAVRKVGDDLGVKSQVPVRVAVTGRRAGPPLFGAMAQMDRTEVLRRLQAGLDRLD